MEEDFRGIILYVIQLNGNLNGVYTNNRTLNSELYTETAQLLPGSVGDFRTNGRMVYDCFFFDAESGRVNATLIFEIENGIINAEWIIEGQDMPTFRGEGYQMNQTQIAIAYWNN